MSGLGKDFFKRDLTEKEWEELEHRLETSGEEADQFLKTAEAAYKKAELPDPVPGLELLSSKRLFFPMGWSLAAAACLVLGFMLFFPKSFPGNSPQADKASLGQSALAPVGPRVIMGKSGIPILVDPKSSGLVHIKVLDSQDRQLRLIYSGWLNSGSYQFGWDGLSQEGMEVDPGKYTILVYYTAQDEKIRTVVEWTGKLP